MTGLNKKVMVKVAVLLFLMGFSAIVEAGRLLDPSFIITQLYNKGDAIYLRRSSSKDCCNACICTLTWPHRTCFCGDAAESCPASCKSCVCTDSIPPQCHCQDSATDNCYVPQCT